MRVLQLGPYPPPAGGVQTHLVAVQEFLHERGIPCAAMNLTRFRRRTSETVLYPRNTFEVVWQLLHRRDDVLHLHLGGDLTLRTVTLGLLCCSFPWAKTVLTFHSGGYPKSRKGQACRRHGYYAFVFRRFDKIIGVNEEIVDFFLRLGVRPERVELIPAGGSLPRGKLVEGDRSEGPPAEPEGRSEVLWRFFEQHDPVLLTVGLLEPEYDIALQIDVLSQVLDEFPRAGLAIIGAGSLENELKRFIASREYAEHILLCGDVPHRDTLRAIASCRVLLRTTWYDGDALSVREALHFGTPVVATDNGMRPPNVHLIPHSNPERLLGAIKKLLVDPQERVRREWDVEGSLAEILAIYEAISRHRRGREERERRGESGMPSLPSS